MATASLRAPVRPFAAAATLAALAWAPAAWAQLDCRKSWHDPGYTLAASARGVELKAVRFCEGAALDHVVQICWGVVNRTNHRVRVDFELHASCGDGTRQSEGIPHSEELAPGQKSGGGENYLSCEQFWAPCPADVIPSQLGWDARVVDLDEEEAKAKLADEIEDERRASEQAKADRARVEQAKADERAAQQAAKQAQAQREGERAATAAEAQAQAEEARRLEREERERRRREEIEAHRQARAEQEAATQATTAASIATFGGAMAGAPDRVAPPKAATRRMTFQVGLYYGSYPTVVDTSWEGTANTPTSEAGDSMGVGGYVGAEAWMLDYPGFGAAAFGSFGYGTGAAAGLQGYVQEYEFGMRGRLGSRAKLGLLVEGGRQSRFGSTSFYASAGLAEVFSTGTGDATLDRLGLGGFLCMTPTEHDGCMTWVEGWLLKEKGYGLTLDVYRAAFRYEGFALLLDYAKDYPLMGAPANTFEGRATGTLVSAALVKEWDWWPK